MRHHSVYSLLFLVALLLVGMSNPSHSQTLLSTQYTINDGLASNWTTALAQDTRGYMWIGTSEGLCKFDGISFTTFTTKDGLPDNFVQVIAEDKRRPGFMLIGTHNGLASFRNGVMRTIHVGTQEASLGVSDILFDHRGTIWLGTNSGLYVLDDTVARKYNKVDTLGVSELDELKDGTICITGNQDVVLLSPDRKQIHRVSLALTHGRYTTDASADSDGSAWIGTDDSLLVHLRDSTIIGKYRMPDAWIQSLLEGGDGTLWACSGIGLLRIPKQYPERAFSSFAISGSSLLRDREKNLWLTCRGRGVYKLASPSLTVFADTTAGSGITERSNAVDRRQHVWCISHGGLYEYWQKEQGPWQRAFHKIEGILAPHWFSIDAQDRLWLSDAASTLLSWYTIVGNGDEQSALRLMNQYDVKRSPHYFFIGGKDEIWLAYPDTPTLVRFNIRNNTVVNTFNPPSPHFGPRSSLLESDSLLWVGEFDDGLFYTRLDSTQSWHVLTIANGLPDNYIRALFLDHDRSLWIGTRYGGAAVYRNGKIETFEVKDGLPSNWIHAIYQDSTGRIWFSTSLGLAYLENPSSSTFHTIPETQYEDNFASGEVRKGIYWIRTDTKFMLYDFNAENEKAIPPFISISDAEMNGIAITTDSADEFPHDKNLFSVGYTGIYFKDPRSLRYFYRLDGVDNTWRGPTDRRSITYSSLNPGSYTFTVKARTGSGVESVRAATVHFSITPAFWDRWWFRTVIIMLILSIAPLIYIRRVNVLKRKNKMQEQFSRQLIESQENERKRIAASLHDGLGQNLILSKNHAMMGLKISKEPASIEHLNEISSLLSQSLDEAREIAYNLRPYHLDRIGLTRTLEYIIDKVRSSAAITGTTEIDTIDHLLPPDGELSVYRVIQESLNNIVKHSSATEMHCSIQKTINHIRIEIRDNGKGFDTHAPVQSSKGNGGFGLAGMAERIRLLNGTMETASHPNNGTTLTFTLPFKSTR